LYCCLVYLCGMHAANALSTASAASPVSAPIDAVSETQQAISADASDRIALVIGNADNSLRPLPNALNDARAMAQALRAAGFDVTVVLNADDSEMNAQLERFLLRQKQGSVSLLYFSGHARMEDGETVLLPAAASDGHTATEQHKRGMRLQNVLRRTAGARQIILLDTCLTASPQVSGNSWKPLFLPTDSLVAHAAQPGSGAGDTATHGIFTARLLKSMSFPQRSIEALLAETARDVATITKGRQRPWIASSLAAPLDFNDNAAALGVLRFLADSASDTIVAYDTRGVLPKDTNEQYELTFWESIKDSNHISDYEAYLQTYPKGRFAGLAKARIDRLRASAPKEAPKEAAREAAKEAPRETPKAVPSRPPAKAAEPPRVAQPKESPPAAPAASPSSPASAGTTATPPAASPAPSAQSAPSATQDPSPKRAAAAGEIKDCPTCPDMITLPAGGFTMGSNTGDPSEKPEHRVTIAAPFAIGKFEVTMEQWNACVDTGGCTKVTTDANRPKNVPVRDVSWEDAQQYVKWLTKVTGKPYRLPTEAEWEYAARGGTATKFWWGEQMRKGTANCKDCGEPWQQEAPVPAGSFAPNPFGLHDVNGSVWEWVNDCWHNNFKGAPGDGKSWEDANCRVRVIRGGSWRENASYMPSSTRFKYDANVRHSQNGFRVVREMK
jgi:formylglycine-generating enzyme required for sulfatase activity